MEPFVDHLLVDAAGFLKLVALQKVGLKVYTVEEVVEEIKDKQTRERLQVLPYELIYIDPSVEDLKFVTDFSKKTGDYASLSATDLKVIAATLQLEKLHVGSEHLKSTPTVCPTKKDIATPEASANNEKHTNLPVGFYRPAKKMTENLEKLSIDDHAVDPSTTSEPSPADSSSEEDENENNDDQHWITPENLAALKQAEGHERITVGCMTGDFSIQNVLLHIGLKVVSIDGCIVKRLNTYILRCFACFKTTSIMTKKFCPECGNATLKRVAITVNEDGTQKIHISKRRTINTKGFNKTIPLFRGGKHADNPIICPDQPIPENRLSKKALQKLNVLDSEYTTRDSPFLDKDIYSRSALLGVRKLTANKTRRKR